MNLGNPHIHDLQEAITWYLEELINNCPEIEVEQVL